MNMKLRELSTMYVFDMAYSSLSQKDGLDSIVKSYRWNNVHCVTRFTIGQKTVVYNSPLVSLTCSDLLAKSRNFPIAKFLGFFGLHCACYPLQKALAEEEET